MNLTRLSPRRMALAALVVVSALGATACSGFGPVGPSAAAEVNGTAISSDDVFSLLAGAQRTEEKQGGGSGESGASTLTGAGLADTWQMTSFTQLLQSSILREVIEQELDDRGIEVTDAQRDEARSQLVQQAGGEEQVATVDKTLLDWSVDATASQMALLESVSDEGGDEAREQALREAYEQVKNDAIEVCISAVFTESEADAQDVKGRLDGGEDIATVAEDASTEPQSAGNGGQLGCGSFTQVVEYVGPGLTADSENGDVLEPYQTEAVQGQAWVVGRVDSITVPTFDDLRPQLEQSVPDTNQANQQRAMSVILRRADVTVASKYGTWDAETAQVIPPAGAPSGSTDEAEPEPGTEGIPSEGAPAEGVPSEQAPATGS